jgi:DDE superfamily endonuclease
MRIRTICPRPSRRNVATGEVPPEGDWPVLAVLASTDAPLRAKQICEQVGDVRRGPLHRLRGVKTTTFSDGQGRVLLSGAVRPGRMHDQTALRTEGIAEQFRTRPTVRARVDSGYQGLAKEFPDQVSAPPNKPADQACDGDKYAWQEARRRQSSARICVEHTNAELRQWAPLRRFTGRRDTYAETHPAIAGLVSDPIRPAGYQPTDEHRARPRPRHRLLITTSRTARPARPDLNFPRGRKRWERPVNCGPLSGT